MLVNHTGDSTFPLRIMQEEPADKGGGDKGDVEGGKAAGETVSKADYDKIVGDLDKIKQDLEDTRMEFLTPEYLEFLDAKKPGKQVPSNQSHEGEVDFSKMTPKQIVEYVETKVAKEVNEKINEVKESVASTSKEATQKEIAAFARSHADFELLRPTMYGLSLEPKHKDFSLEELYKAAKDQVKRIHAEPSDEEKARARRATGEKPTGSSSALVKDKKLTPDEAAEEAWKVAVPDGVLPTE